MLSKHNLTPVFIAACALFLGGCASLAPEYKRPPAPVAAQFPVVSGAMAAASTTPASGIEWQSFFTDAKLKQLIETALLNNRDLRIAVLNIEQARAQFQIRRAEQFPTINAALTGARQPNPTPANGAGRITSVYSAGLAVTAYELDFFGRVASLKDAALAQYLATEEGRKTAQISLIASVANTYLALLADDELLAITQQTLATRQASYKLAKLRFDSGLTSELDLRSAESLLEAANTALAQQTRQRAVSENALTLLVGQSLGSDLAGKDAAFAKTTLQDIPAGLPSDLLVHRPDIRQAEQLLIAANANIGAARAAFFPRISLTATAGTASSRLAGLFQAGTWGWTLAPQLLLPIFDAGRNTAGLASSKAAEGIAVATYEKAIQTAFKEVSDALAGRATYAEQLRAAQAQANAEAVRYRLADLRYQNGVTSQLDQLDAQRSLFAARQAVVQTRLAQLQSQVTLYKVLGGGWKDEAVATPAPSLRP
ncbi:MAG: efflux transporter outer membrane subunit [Polaromonas sp.]